VTVLSRMPEKERAKALIGRLEEIRHIANDLKTLSRKSWKCPASVITHIRLAR
jgi:hypothetical protein